MASASTTKDFEFMGGPGSLVTVACRRCGAYIVDWPKAGDEWTQERPNQDRHREWHRQHDAA